MRCKYCGEKIEKGYQYCIGCGKPTKDSIEEYLKDESKNKTNQSMEYFEIENGEKKDEEYDFSHFLNHDNEEQEEIEFSTIHEELGKSTFEEDNLEDTKKRTLFERSDFNLFGSLNKNNARKVIDKNSGKQYTENERFRKNNNEKNFEFDKNVFNYNQNKFNSREKIDINNNSLKLKRKRIGKQIRNVIYNIIVLILALLLSIWLYNPISQFLNYTGLTFFYYLSDYMIILGVFLVVIFLLIPFFSCKGNAKIPLLFLSILLSWTIVGWIVLFVVSLTSNNKWQIRMLD